MPEHHPDASLADRWLGDRLDLPDGYRAQRYRGRADHADIARVLGAYREHHGDPEGVNAEEIDRAYAHLSNCDPDRDIYLLRHDVDGVIGYGRASFDDLTDNGMADDVRDLVVFAPTEPAHLSETLFHRIADAQEAHLAQHVPPGEARYRAYAPHPGPGLTPTGEAAWLESRGYLPTHWGATLVRPDLEGVDELAAAPLPDGVEVRPVGPDQLVDIVTAHHECFRGEWDFREMTDQDLSWIIDSSHRDESLWQVAWHGDQIVGQVKPFINAEENAERGYLRGYTEYISTHHDWRNRGIARALLGRALRAVRDAGMTEAVLGVDTNNPGGAFHLYRRLGPAHARSALLASAGLGTFFLLFQGYEWVQLIGQGLTLTSSNHGAFFYLIVGIHALHAIAALALLWTALWRLTNGRLLYNTFLTAQVFWYFVVGIWPIVYVRVYL